MSSIDRVLISGFYNSFFCPGDNFKYQNPPNSPYLHIRKYTCMETALPLCNALHIASKSGSKMRAKLKKKTEMLKGLWKMKKKKILLLYQKHFAFIQKVFVQISSNNWRGRKLISNK